MNLNKRIERLESRIVTVDPLTPEQHIRFQELTDMDPDHPDYNVLEFLDLYYKSRPGLTFEQSLREAMDEW